MLGPKRVRSVRALAVTLSIAGAATACGSSGGISDADRSADSTTVPSTSTSATDRSAETTENSTPRLNKLAAVIDATVALPRMSFTSTVTSSMPGASAPVINSTSGSFDDEFFNGVGTRTFTSDDPTITEMWGGAAFEFVMLDDTMWMLNPIGSPPQWNGFDIYDCFNATGTDPTASIDGDVHLLYLLDALSEVRDVVERDDGSVDWLVTVRADDLVPLLNSGGAASRLAGLGADQSGIETELTLHQGADGYLTGATGDFDEWWTHAISLTEFVDTTSETMHLELRLEPYEEPLVLSSPCEGREIVVGEDLGVSGQACEA